MVSLFLRFFLVSLAVSALLLPLLLLRRKLEQRYAPQTRWGLWLGIALVLLVVPWLPKPQAPVMVTAPVYQVVLPVHEGKKPVATQGHSGLSAQGQAQTVTPVSGQSQERSPVLGQPEIPVVTHPETPAALPVEEETASVSLTLLASILWLAGMAAVLLWQSGRYLLLRRCLMKGARPIKGLDHYALELELAEVAFYQCKNIPGPMTLGLVHPVVLLPEGGAAPAALCHELYHIKRHDVTYKTMLMLTCAVHWFNPLVWLMARQADRDVEACCDAAVVKKQDTAYKRAYGELLLAAASGEHATPFSTHFGGGKEQMKSRLSQLFRPGKRSRVLVCGLLAAALLLSSLVACQEKTLTDGVYCAAWGEFSWPVGEQDAEGEDYGSIRLTLRSYDEENGPGETLGEYTLPLSKNLMLRQLWWGEDQNAGERGTQEWQQAVAGLLSWPIYRDSIPLGTDYLVVTVKDGEVTCLSWALVDGEGALNPDEQAYLTPLTANTMPNFDYYDQDTGFLVYHSRDAVYFYYGDSCEVFHTDGGTRVLTDVRVSTDGRAVYFEDCQAEGGEDLRFYRYDVGSRETAVVGARFDGKTEAELAAVVYATEEELYYSGFTNGLSLRSNVIKTADGTLVGLWLDDMMDATIEYLRLRKQKDGVWVGGSPFLTPELIPAPRDYTDPDWGFTLHLPEELEGQYVVSKSANWWGFYEKEALGNGQGFLMGIWAEDSGIYGQTARAGQGLAGKDGITYDMDFSSPEDAAGITDERVRQKVLGLLSALEGEMSEASLDLSGVTRSSGYLWPLPYTEYGSDLILRPYEEEGYHAIDIIASNSITVQCAANGVVVQTEGPTVDGTWEIIVDQGDGSFAMYAHLGDIYVTTGDHVTRGMLLGPAGMENGRRWVTFARLEGESWDTAQYVDPFGDLAADPITYRTYDFQTVSRDTVIFAGDPEIAEAYRRVLEDVTDFWDVERQEWRSVSSLSEDGVSVTVKRYAVVDMDNDTVPELVLWLDRGGNEYSMGSIVLRYEKGLVCGYPMGYRSMNLSTLKTDGTFDWSGGAFHYGTGRLNFHTGEREDITWVDALNEDYEAKYFANGYAATQAEWENANLMQAQKQDVVWHIFSDVSLETLKWPEQYYGSESYPLVAIEGLEFGLAFEDIPGSLRDSLVKGKAEDLTGEGVGLWTTYTAPGVEVVTTQVDPEAGIYEGEVGKEFISMVRLTDSQYATKVGLRVGDSLERCLSLGYKSDGTSSDGSIVHMQAEISWLKATLENGVVTQIEVCDGLRMVGSIFY